MKLSFAKGRGAWPRKGAWAMLRDRVGIIAEIGPMSREPSHGGDIDVGIAEFHHLDKQGDTTLVEMVTLGSLKQPKLAQIPGPRRPTSARGSKFGYT